MGACIYYLLRNFMCLYCCHMLSLINLSDANQKNNLIKFKQDEIILLIIQCESLNHMNLWIA